MNLLKYLGNTGAVFGMLLIVSGCVYDDNNNGPRPHYSHYHAPPPPPVRKTSPPRQTYVVTKSAPFHRDDRRIERRKNLPPAHSALKKDHVTRPLPARSVLKKAPVSRPEKQTLQNNAQQNTHDKERSHDK